MKDKTIEVLSDLTVHMKYAKYLPELNRRETWEELIARNKRMHIEKYPQLKTEIIDVYENFVATKKVLPSMRSLQFGGKPIEVSPNRIYNCAYLPVDDWRAFGEIMFLLLGGTGVGFSVQRHHIEKLPEIRKPQKTRRYLIGDSIEGWADAVKFLMKSYFTGGAKPEFDFRDIRPKGANLITSGGKAPGPEPLKRCLTEIELMLERKENGSQLKPIEVHDIVCHIADAVLAGGIRRAALISLFSFDDEDMRTCKFGNWWELNSQRGRANNSAVIIRNRIRKSDFINLWKKIEASGSGEPGVYFNNDKDWGTNPCCLTGDTLIQTFDGELTIKEIVEALESGNRVPEVWSYNTETGEKELDTIDAGQLMRKDAEIISLEMKNGTVLKLTPDHRVYTQNREWVVAGQLTKEDDLLYNDSVIKIKNITIEKNEDVYDIQVRKNHNFFANGILVHNCEISLRPFQFCNLTEINVDDVETQEELEARARAAAFIGTLQAGYTNFHYLRPIWKRTTEKDALIGVGMTGIGSGKVLHLDMKAAAATVLNENARVADLIGINHAARTTTVKPSGCLDKDTKIKTSIGEITLSDIFEANGYTIEEISQMQNTFLPVREKIWVYNEKNELELISQLFVNGVAEEMIEFELDGTTVRCTLNHKFLTSNRGWVEAQHLTEEDDILSY